MSLFGQSSNPLSGNPQQSQSSNPFGQTPTPPAKSVFGSTTPSNPFASTPANPFAQSTNVQNIGGGFGGSNTGTTGLQPQLSSVFGAPSGSAQQQGSGLFGQPQQQAGSIFGAVQPQQQQQQQPNQPSSNLFSGNNSITLQQSQPGTNSLFGTAGNAAQNQQPQQQQQSGSLFQLGQGGQQQQQQQQQQQSQQPGGSLLQTSRLWQQPDMLPRMPIDLRYWPFSCLC